MSELLLWEYFRENFLRINQLCFLKSSGCWVEQTMFDILHVCRPPKISKIVSSKHWNSQISDGELIIPWGMVFPRWVTQNLSSKPEFLQLVILISGFPVSLSNVPHLPMMSGTDKLKPPLAIVTNEISWDFKCNMFSKDNKQHIFQMIHVCIYIICYIIYIEYRLLMFIDGFYFHPFALQKQCLLFPNNSMSRVQASDDENQYASHQQPEQNMTIGKAMGWISSRFHSFISFFFSKSPKGVMSASNGKMASQKKKCPLPFWRLSVSDRLPPFFVEFSGFHLIPVSSSHLLNLSQTGSFPQKNGVKRSNYFNLPLLSSD